MLENKEIHYFIIIEISKGFEVYKRNPMGWFGEFFEYISYIIHTQLVLDFFFFRIRITKVKNRNL